MTIRPFGRLTIALGLGALLADAVPASAQQRAVAQAVRVNGEAPTIDGVLDEAVWLTAPPITEFLQRDPNEGAIASESTVVRFLYSDSDLYVGFRGYDSEPHRIFGRLVRRDQRTASDYFNLFIDSYHDRRQAFEFAINPSGARRDVFIYDDGAGRDESWDPVYAWATKIDSLGWTVEMRIPFSQLRFPQRDSLTFGIRIRRAINRRNEEANWPFFPRDLAGEVSQYGDLVGMLDVPSPRRLEILPYTAGSATFQEAVPSNPFLARGRSQTVRAGGDLKIGLTSGITLDATANPDFGQVEADAAVVNLTAFESFFPEKRPFFVEGTNLFQFSMTPSQRNEFGFGGGFGGQEGLVYTRRVGRSPQISASSAGGYVKSVEQSTILGAAKMSGQLGRGWSVGLMQAVTQKEYAPAVDSLGTEFQIPVEPLTSSSVLRLQRAQRRGRLAYGLIGTSVVRQLSDSTFLPLHDRAFTGGSDLYVRFGRDRYELQASAMGSYVQGSPSALIATQRRSSRYFQRPDADHVEVDSALTHLMGFAGFAQLAKTTGFFTWQAQYQTRSPGFESNDLGFLRQADVHTGRGEMEFRWFTPGRIFRQFELQFTGQAQATYGWERTRTSVEAQASGDFRNYWNVSATAERQLEALDVTKLRGGPAVLNQGAWDMRLSMRSDFRRRINFNASASRTVEDLTGAGGYRLNGSVRWRPPGSLSASVDARMSWDEDDAQYITRRTIVDSTYYVLGRLDRRELSLTFRIDVALTPRLSIELYAQPFVSAGTYTPFKLAADPKAADYGARYDVLTDVAPDTSGASVTCPGGRSCLAADRVYIDTDNDGTPNFSFANPNFRSLSFRSNLVVRWEFLPGSTIFLVWQQSRGERTTASREGIRGITDVLNAPGQNVLAVKVSYWIGM